jgi:hypothetical protein
MTVGVLAMTAALVIAVAMPAQAATPTQGPNGYVWYASTVKSDGGTPNFYWGFLSSADGNWVYVQRRNTSGTWAETGFQVCSYAPGSSCNPNTNAGWVNVSQAGARGTGVLQWRVYNGPNNGVTGLRFRKGNYWYSHHCIGVADCLTLPVDPLFY